MVSAGLVRLFESGDGSITGVLRQVLMLSTRSSWLDPRVVRLPRLLLSRIAENFKSRHYETSAAALKHIVAPPQIFFVLCVVVPMCFLLGRARGPLTAKNPRIHEHKKQPR